jgi:nucleolar pre-ribosomal-associated protein 2
MGGKDLEMLDVDAQHTAEPSLQRLKTLDSLPDLKSQLKTANEFCNHRHRAEMILRWLTGKMQADKKVASNADAWGLLEHCFRLVAPQKMGILLARFDLLDTARGAMQDLEDKKLLRLLAAVAKSIETLEEISSGIEGAVVKQLLSKDGASVAALLGVWLGRMTSLESGNVASKSGSNDNLRLALPAIRLWDIRKPGSSDNDVFAKECLVPCSLLLQQLSSATTSGSKKRNRVQNTSSSDVDVAHDLEILIARHVFLPARSALFQAAEQPDSEETTSDLTLKLSSVKSTIAAADTYQAQLCKALPKLLDIALRCVPMTTSRQRSKERPWVEHSFQELLTCLDIDGKLVSQDTLSAMLQTVGKRASLPGTTLKDLVQRYSGLTDAKETKPVDFTLIAEVVALDATVFVDAAMADHLFPALTGVSDFLAGAADVTVARSLLVDSITKPVMRAFASSRKLENFVSRWQQQLQTVEDHKVWTVWTQLDDVLAELLELQLTAEQTEQLFDNLYSEMDIESQKSSKKSSSKDALTPQTQRAGAVLLHALLQGVRSDGLIERLHSRISNLLDALLVLVQGSKVKSISPQVWHLLALTFRLWFPMWAVTQSNSDNVLEKGQSLLSHPAVESIIKAKAAGKNVDIAETFAGLLCSTFQKYEGCRELACDVAKRLAPPTTSKITPVFLAFPDLLSFIEKDDRLSLIKDVVTSGIASHSADADNTTTHLDLTAFVHSAVTSSNTKLADDVIAAVLASSDSTEKEHAVLDLLLQIPASTLARGQRERILNWTTDLEYSSEIEETRLTKRYAVMIHLMQLPNATANLCTDASVVWKLCRTSSASKKSKSGKEKKSTKSEAQPNQSTLAMLAELTRQISVYLLATQDQERSRAALKDLVKAAVTEASTTEDIDSASSDRLVVLKTIIQQTDSGTGKGVLSHLAGDDAPSLVTFAERVLKETSSSVKTLKKKEDTPEPDTKLRVLFELLVCLRKSNIVGEALAESDKALVKVCNKILVKSSDDVAVSRPGTNNLLVPAFSLLAHISGFEACISLGEALLGASISPEDRHRLTEELKQLAKDSKPSVLLTVLQKVIPNPDEASAQGFAILENTLTAVTKDILTSDEQGIHALYFKLLEILRQTPDFATYTAAVPCVLTIIREKPFILNQYLTEATLQTIHSLARSSPAEPLIYLDLCSILSALLLHHRARLQGRYHLLISTLQSLQMRLFIPTTNSTTTTSTSNNASRKTLTPRHARAYTRLLTLLCNPPTRTHNNNSTSSAANAGNLIDESRRTRARVGEFAPLLLHSFCAAILNGTLGEGVREALTPGLWALIEAMEVQSADAVKVLSAAMNNSERAVLRGVYEDWKRFAKWDGA